jgi:SAM-dependent methyltransferase
MLLPSLRPMLRSSPTTSSDLPNYFGESAATHYDDDVARMFEAATLDATVDFLAALAGEGPVLELGIGTGRVALPLAARGITVAGIDLSEEMVARLRAKPGGDAIQVAIGDFATTQVDAGFTLAYLVFNTIGNLTTQEAQVACFRNVAAHLVSGGSFVIELGVPDLRRLPPGERFVLFDKSDGHVGIDEYDVATQRLVSHHYSRRDEGEFEYESLPFRYVWPAELDLMAQLAGMELRERWSDWRREPFDNESTSHVSVWQKSA